MGWQWETFTFYSTIHWALMSKTLLTVLNSLLRNVILKSFENPNSRKLYLFLPFNCIWHLFSWILCSSQSEVKMWVGSRSYVWDMSLLISPGHRWINNGIRRLEFKSWFWNLMALWSLINFLWAFFSSLVNWRKSQSRKNKMVECIIKGLAYDRCTVIRLYHHLSFQCNTEL